MEVGGARDGGALRGGVGDPQLHPEPLELAGQAQANGARPGDQYRYVHEFGTQRSRCVTRLTGMGHPLRPSPAA
jgi:hypothetical protein